MRHLLTDWENLAPRFKNRRVALFLDYDGTLTPIVARPCMAKITPQQRSALRELSQQKDIHVVMISGRKLDDVKKCVGIPGLIYVGNHGLELEGPRIKHVHPAALDFRRLAKKLVNSLQLVYAFLPEVVVESKKYSISVHYRQLDKDKIEFAKMILFKAVGFLLGKGKIVIQEGKKVWEIRPPVEWNKGQTALWLLSRMRADRGKRVIPIYVGDDVSDENAFKALKPHGVTIRVTEDPGEASAADYFVDSPEEIYHFLDWLVKIKQA